MQPSDMVRIRIMMVQILLLGLLNFTLHLSNKLFVLTTCCLCHGDTVDNGQFACFCIPDDFNRLLLFYNNCGCCNLASVLAKVFLCSSLRAADRSASVLLLYVLKLFQIPTEPTLGRRFLIFL